jgi:hypothetical protein
MFVTPLRWASFALLCLGSTVAFATANPQEGPKATPQPHAGPPPVVVARADAGDPADRACLNALLDSLTLHVLTMPGPHPLHHPAETDDETTRTIVHSLLELPYGPPNALGRRPKLGDPIRAIPACIQDTAPLAVDFAEGLERRDVRMRYLDYALLALTPEEVTALRTFLEDVAARGYPFDFPARFAVTYDFVASRLSARAYHRALRALGTMQQSAVLRALRVLALREQLLRRGADGELAEPPTWLAALAIARSARWSDAHRHSVALGDLLREVAWIALDAPGPEAAAAVIRWLVSESGSDARTFLATASSPEPDALLLGPLLDRSIRVLRRVEVERFVEFLTHYAARHGSRRSTEARGYAALLGVLRVLPNERPRARRILRHYANGYLDAIGGRRERLTAALGEVP